jgi:predicted RNA-binding protein
MTNEELERAVEHLAAVARSMSGDFTRITFPEEVAVKTADAIRALLTERAELLATVERMRGALEFYAFEHAFPSDGPWGVNSDDFGEVARAALTTGEGK